MKRPRQRGWLARVHRQWIHPRRVTKLASAFLPLIDQAGTRRLLDVGCGDGLLASTIGQALRSLHVFGCEIHPPASLCDEATAIRIPVVLFDGRSLPFEDNCFDAALLCDVLHHCEDKGASILSEAARVSRVVFVKDHFEPNRLGRYLLRWMDWVGNHDRDIFMPRTYFTPGEFQMIASEAGLQITASLSVDLPPHSSFHFVAQLAKP
ncbi:MAG: methyltransferase domain-containing protein [Verrucomicrobiia bacterium]